MTELKKARKAAVIITTADPEIRVLALRCAAFHLEQSEDVSVFLVVPGSKAGKDCSPNSAFGSGLKSFVTDGGRVYSCRETTELKKRLHDCFPELSEETICDLLDGGQLKSIMTSDVYIRVFR
jgi:hypothetical protein